MTMKQCSACGAKNIVRDEWQGGDLLCDHFFVDVVPSSILESEIKLLMSTWTPHEIRAAVRNLCGVEV